MHPVLGLPVVPEPDYELGGASELKSIADSFVLLQSLRQSRDKWLSSTFPKFSTMARRGKVADVVPPPHIIRSHGKCELEVGPHIFPDTTIYEVHYLQPNVPPPYHSSIGTRPPSTVPSSSPRASTPLITSLASEIPVTPSLVAQVNAAATTNPTLANLVQLAATGRASPEQLRTLGLLIQSMAHTANLPGSSSVSPSTPPPTSSGGSLPPTSSDIFDIVIEFHESSSERFIFPRGPVVCTQNDIGQGAFEILMTTLVPFPSSPTAPNPPDGNMPPHMVTFRLTKTTVGVWDLLLRWAGGEARMEENARFLDEMTIPERSFLQHRLPEGEKLDQIRHAASPQPPMKFIKPSQDGTRTKRKPAPRKPPLEFRDATPQSVDISPPAPKKRKTVPTKKPETPPRPQIACFTCGQTDVPLLMGGRFCRICIDSGRAKNEIPSISGGLSSRMAPLLSNPLPALRTSVGTGQPPKPPAPRKMKGRLPSTASTSMFVSSPLASHPPAFPRHSPIPGP
ncbi:hypothetical protein JAAARDRAFT_374082 [Jaapia argillacea MUCL 33604]|uniref:Uncharacterized protein n=1 Tax=Jaapia argillacea MUCL 33604 TaxID=933084 RepID=A0A067Q8J3_9AGAM|nr:hypothetical protein JAAARDRAFT_374082 [Jaapia argillacea MUCL 33604]